MKLSTAVIAISTTTAQISIGRSDNTISDIECVPGCYPILPAIIMAKVAENFKVEFYNDYNCQGSKVGEASNYSAFEAPIHATSVKVIKSSEDSKEDNESEDIEEVINSGENQTSSEGDIDSSNQSDESESEDEEVQNPDKSKVKEKEASTEGYQEKANYADFKLNKLTKYKIGDKKLRKEDLANYTDTEFEVCEKNESGKYDEDCVSYDDLFNDEDGGTDLEENNNAKVEDKEVITDEKSTKPEEIESENKEDETRDGEISNEVEGYVVSKCHH
jgi:hypothetical protein